MGEGSLLSHSPTVDATVLDYDVVKMPCTRQGARLCGPARTDGGPHALPALPSCCMYVSMASCMRFVPASMTLVRGFPRISSCTAA